MGADTLLVDLIARGITLTPDGPALRVRGTLTEADRASIRAHKPALLAALAATEHQEARSVPTPMPSIPPHVACSTCAHLDGERCTVRRYSPILPHIAMRLCGAYEVRL